MKLFPERIDFIPINDLLPSVDPEKSPEIESSVDKVQSLQSPIDDESESEKYPTKVTITPIKEESSESQTSKKDYRKYLQYFRENPEKIINDVSSAEAMRISSSYQQPSIQSESILSPVELVIND